MADPIVTPDLVETAAEALANHYYRPDGWSKARDEFKAVYRSSARAVLAAVLPVIDRAARADELRKQATELRARARWNKHGGKHFAGAETRHTVINLAAGMLESRAAALLSAPTEENTVVPLTNLATRFEGNARIAAELLTMIRAGATPRDIADYATTLSNPTKEN